MNAGTPLGPDRCAGPRRAGRGRLRVRLDPHPARREPPARDTGRPGSSRRNPAGVCNGARPYLFVENCSSCHGDDMRGDSARGIPDLQDAIWLYGEGRISDIGTPSSTASARGTRKRTTSPTMPAFLRIGQLSTAEIGDVIEYVLSLSKKPHDEAAARRGYELYANKGNCLRLPQLRRARQPGLRRARADRDPCGCTAARATRCSSPSPMGGTGSVPRGSIN